MERNSRSSRTVARRRRSSWRRWTAASRGSSRTRSSAWRRSSGRRTASASRSSRALAITRRSAIGRAQNGRNRACSATWSTSRTVLASMTTAACTYARSRLRAEMSSRSRTATGTTNSLLGRRTGAGSHSRRTGSATATSVTAGAISGSCLRRAGRRAN